MFNDEYEIIPVLFFYSTLANIQKNFLWLQKLRGLRMSVKFFFSPFSSLPFSPVRSLKEWEKNA